MQQEVLLQPTVSGKDGSVVPNTESSLCNYHVTLQQILPTLLIDINFDFWL